jgi:hypothetical protein
MSPNEARNAEGFDSVEFGDDVRTQAQNVPLSAAGQIPSAPSAPAAPAAPVNNGLDLAEARRAIEAIHAKVDRRLLH